MKKSLLFLAAALACSACDFPDALPPVFDTNTSVLYVYDGDTEGSYILSGNITLSSSYNWNVENSASNYITIDSGSYGSGGVHFFRPQLTEALKALLAEPDQHFTLVAGSGYLIAKLLFNAPSYAGGSHSISIYYAPNVRLTFDINGGTGEAPGAITGHLGQDITLPDVGNVSPPEDRYFDGWNEEADGSGTKYAPGDNYTLKTDATLYAVYAPNVRLSFNINGGNGDAPGAISGRPGKDITLPEVGNVSPPKDYFFDGWNEEADGSGTQYAAGDNYTLKTDATLYAVWTERGLSADTPKLITTEAELRLIGNEATSRSRYYKLMEDISLNSEWTPIGPNNANPFTGSFDGNGKKISDLKVNNKYAGLFGYINSGNKIAVQNLHLVGVEIEGDESIGAVAGILASGIIQGCSVTGMVSVIGGVFSAGGIAGQSLNNSSILNCYVTAEISANGAYPHAGGIAGRSLDNSSILNCYVTAEVSTTGTLWAYAGGIAGYCDNNSSILNCYATGTVSANGNYPTAGGIAGFASRSIQNCYATAEVSANGQNSRAGGIAGSFGGGSYTNSIQNCVALNISVNGITARRLLGNNNNCTLNNNYGWEEMCKNGATPQNDTWTSNLTGEDGANLSTSEYESESWWSGASGIWTSVWGGTDDDHPWVWDSANSRPKFYWQ